MSKTPTARMSTRESLKLLAKAEREAREVMKMPGTSEASFQKMKRVIKTVQIQRRRIREQNRTT